MSSRKVSSKDGWIVLVLNKVTGSVRMESRIMEFDEQNDYMRAWPQKIMMMMITSPFDAQDNKLHEAQPKNKKYDSTNIIIREDRLIGWDQFINSRLFVGDQSIVFMC